MARLSSIRALAWKVLEEKQESKISSLADGHKHYERLSRRAAKSHERLVRQRIRVCRRERAERLWDAWDRLAQRVLLVEKKMVCWEHVRAKIASGDDRPTRGRDGSFPKSNREESYNGREGLNKFTRGSILNPNRSLNRPQDRLNLIHATPWSRSTNLAAPNSKHCCRGPCCSEKILNFLTKTMASRFPFSADHASGRRRKGDLAENVGPRKILADTDEDAFRIYGRLEDGSLEEIEEDEEEMCYMEDV